MNNFGVGCFLSKNLLIYGKVKTKSSDFEVHEINLEGNIAGVQDSDHKKMKITETTENKNCANNATCVKSNTDVSERKQCSEPSFECWSNVLKDGMKSLSDVIGDDNLKMLTQMGKHSMDKTLDLGVFNDKVKRTIIHQCIRYNFPFLITHTVKSENETKLTCCRDAIYQRMIEVGFTETMASDLIKFVNCRSLWCLENLDKAGLNIDVHTFTRGNRKALHHFINKHYGKLIESKTIIFNHRTVISIRFKERKNSQCTNERKRKCKEDIIIVTLFKNNIELLTVLQKLATQLGVQLSNIKYAGIKDKKAVTYQFVSIAGVTTQVVQDVINGQFDNWYICHPKVTSSHLQLGDLQGNRFKIIIRNLIQGTTSQSSNGENTTQRRTLYSIINQSVMNVISEGFINYFGEQRFGYDQTAARIGLALLRENYMQAVDLLLSPKASSESEEDNVVEASKRCFVNTRNAKETLKTMPAYKTRERLVLQALNRYSYSEEGCLKAFLNIPYAMRLFFVHSYCSLIWNKVVAERILTHGFDLLPGDFVNRGGNNVMVNADDVNSKSYTIFDVVLPLPGSSIAFPENATKDIYHNLLSIDRIDKTSFKLKKLGFNVQGSYRNIIVKPSNLTWELSHSSSMQDKSKADLLLEFDLPSSSYATMMIRELMHDG